MHMRIDNTVANKEPMIRITKRSSISITKAWLVRIAAVLLSLIVCALVIVAITKQNPINVYLGIIDGAIGRNRRLWVTIRETLTLLIIAVALTPAFKMKFWNIGAEGQILMGAAATAALMIYGGKSMPTGLLIVLIFAGSCLAGMIWGLLPAIFKAYFNTNETLFTLMLNYVAMQIVNFCIVYWENPAGSNTVGIINSSTHNGWFPKVFGLNYGMILTVVLAITVAVHIYMKHSKHGYEIAVVGESHSTAKYAGIDVKKVIIRTMLISGAICGIAGALIVSGASHTISLSTGGGRGFTAIIIAWMSKFNPWAMAVISAFLAFMQQGSIQIATQYGLNESASDIITGIVLFFLIGCEFFINYKVEFHRKKKEVQKIGIDLDIYPKSNRTGN
jgi:general nucleoside transport system permease protein